MRSWQVQEAKARFSELLTICLKEGPQLVSRRGADAAVLVPLDQWRRLNGDGVDLKGLLLSETARTDQLVPPRRQLRRRVPPQFD